MTRLLGTIAVILALTAGAPATGNILTPPCQDHHGPVTKFFGGTEWEIFFCGDNDSLVLHSVEASSASFSPISLVTTNGAYWIRVSGERNQDVIRAALDEIAALNAEEIRALIEKAKQTD